MDRRRIFGTEGESTLSEEFELLGEIDISKYSKGDTMYVQECNCSEIILVWNDMINASDVNSTVDVLINDFAISCGRPKTARSAGTINGYSLIKVLKGIGCIALNSAGSSLKTLYTGSPAALEFPYNFLPITGRIEKIVIRNLVTQYYATSGVIKIYGR